MTTNMIRYIRSILATIVVLAAALASVVALSGEAQTAQAGSGTQPTTALPWLKALNGQIVRADNNQRVELRGANVLHNEWVYPDMSYERVAIPHLASVWHANLITHGFASAPVVAGDATYLGVLDEYQQLAEANNMYVIFCYYYPTINGDQPPNPDVDPNAQLALVDLVLRYRTKSNVMFMLQAEPHSDTWNGQYYRVTWNTLRPTYDTMITAMRAVDNPTPQKHLILASGDGYGRDISPVVVDEYGVGYLDPIRADNGENIVYSSHPYDHYYTTNDWDYFLPVADAGYPVLVTEFGTGGQMDQADTDRLMSLMNNATRHISWTAWIFDSGGCPCLISDGNFTPTDPYGLSVKNRIIDEATNFGGGGPSPTPTGGPLPTATPGGAVLVGHVTWQGRPAQPNVRQQLPITLTLKQETIEVNYPAQDTDGSGFFTVSVAELSNGQYNWRVKGPKFLANGGSLTLEGATRTSFEADLMHTGDCDNNNIVNAQDFDIVNNAMGTQQGDLYYDDRADLDGDHIVGGSDYALLHSNMGTAGAPPPAP